ncbi:MAG: hypothetical protein R6V61_10375, partial [Wenzhouxiangellaceae bacterium]
STVRVAVDLEWLTRFLQAVIGSVWIVPQRQRQHLGAAGGGEIAIGRGFAIADADLHTGTGRDVVGMRKAERLAALEMKDQLAAPAHGRGVDQLDLIDDAGDRFPIVTARVMTIALTLGLLRDPVHSEGGSEQGGGRESRGQSDSPVS